MPRKKIVHILESTATGTLTMVATLANMLVSKDCEVTIIYSQRDETPAELAKYFDNQVSLIRLDMRPFHHSPLFAWRMRELLKEIEPDIIHLHSSIAGFLGRVSSVGIGNVKVFYNPHCISFMMANLKPLRRQAYVVLEKFANMFGGEYVACSESERAAISENIRNAVVHKIDNAIDLESLAPTQPSLEHKQTTVITVGEVRPQKGPELFAEIAKKVTAHSPDVRFKWVGDGIPERKQVLIDAGVEITGWMDKSEVMQHLDESDIYLSTAFWEGLPVSLIEAMALGLPLIGQSCSGNVDLIDDKINGRLFYSADEAIEQINACLDSTDLMKTYSENGVRIAQERYSLENFKAQFSQLYQISTQPDQVTKT